MKTSTSFKDGQLKIYLSGELDHHAAKVAMETISKAIDLNLPRDCVLDLQDLSFMDSSGIAVVLGAYKRMDEISGRACVENVKKQPMKVLQASGIYRMVEISEADKE